MPAAALLVMVVPVRRAVVVLESVWAQELAHAARVPAVAEFGVAAVLVQRVGRELALGRWLGCRLKLRVRYAPRLLFQPVT